MLRDAQTTAQRVCPDGVGYSFYGGLIHARHDAKLFSHGQANTQSLCQESLHGTFAPMENAQPYKDIAERLLWHRTLLGLTQKEYAARINKKRPAYSLWEAGSHRLSLDGALALRQTFGLSLDFLYEGIDDALPMTLRNAWLERSEVSDSK